MKRITDYKSRAVFNQGIAQLLFYRTSNGNIDVPENYVASGNFMLGEWLIGVRCLYTDNMLTDDEIKRLEALGFSFSEEDQNWESMFFLLKEYYTENGDINVPVSYKTRDGKFLGAWVYRQFRFFNNLPECKRNQLQSMRREL